MSKLPIPEAALSDHTAVLGMTGSGKTSTAKLIVEHVVEEGARVCIIDPIKSDWWGITASADGKKPGLPFVILGGPHFHAKLTPYDGKVVGELVASKKLPLSIIDMSEFESAGDMQRFFVDFASTLFRKTRGVLYLVVEEAHEFAPKERAGVGHENLALYWMKKLATGSRTKGIRLVVNSQRVQALHNAVLGSCLTMIGHRLTAPADQEPVIKWVKANLALKEEQQAVMASLAFLEDGEAWLCRGGKNGFAKKMQFPRISTFDNTATPDDDEVERRVETAPVDRIELAKLLGKTSDELAARDPDKLLSRVADLEGQLSASQREAEGLARSDAPAETISTGIAQEDLDLAKEEAHIAGFNEGIEQGRIIVGLVKEKLDQLDGAFTGSYEEMNRALEKYLDTNTEPRTIPPPSPRIAVPAPQPKKAIQHQASPDPRNGRILDPRDVRVLNSLAFWEKIGIKEPSRAQVAFVSGYAPGTGNFQNILGSLRTAGEISYPKPGTVRLESNRGIAMSVTEAREKIRSVLDDRELRVFDALRKLGGHTKRDAIAEASGYQPGTGNFQNILGRLRTLQIIDYPALGEAKITDWARRII